MPTLNCVKFQEGTTSHDVTMNGGENAVLIMPALPDGQPVEDLGHGVSTWLEKAYVT